MGWGGYGLYDGDETQTCHYWNGIFASEEVNYEIFLDN